MVDEDRLAQAVRDLAAGIDVPADGPARVLAARDEAGGPRSPRPANRTRSWPARHRAGLAAGGALVAAVTVVVAVVGNPSRQPTAQFSTAGPVQHGQSGPAGTPSGPFAGVAPSSPAPLTLPVLPTRVIKTGSIDLVVGRAALSATPDQLTSLAAGLGGFVADTKTSEGAGGPTGAITLRVPAAQFEVALTRVRSLGKPVSVTTSGQDVTAQYVDLDARIHSLQASRDQFLQILAKAQQIGDILNVEQQLSSLQTQIEQLQGQQQVLQDQTSYSTLAVQVSEASVPGTPHTTPPPSGLSRAWSHARRSFAHGLESLIAASGGLAVFVLCLALLLLAGWSAWAVVRRRLV